MSSGLRVNFFKSSIYGLNLREDFLEATSVFLHCSIGLLPFKYLGTFVGDSPRKEKSWSYVIDNLRNRLSVWRGKYLSLGGKGVLINSVLNALPIFSLLFYNASIIILKEIIRIQSNVLWGGGSSVRSIH